MNAKLLISALSPMWLKIPSDLTARFVSVAPCMVPLYSLMVGSLSKTENMLFAESSSKLSSGLVNVMSSPIVTSISANVPSALDNALKASIVDCASVVVAADG